MNAFLRSLLLASMALTIVAIGCGHDATTTDPSRATISATQLHERLASPAPKPLVVDVREPFEYRAGHIEGAQLAPLGTVETALDGVARDREIVLVCRTDNRSGQAQRRLAERGFTNLRNMDGGMVEWEKKGLPVVKP